MRARAPLLLLLLGSGCGGAEAEPERFERRPAALPDPESGEAFWLSQVQLYRDLGTKQVAPDALPFAPRYVLWSDGARKQRWLVLPEGGVVDSSDMDHWEFPVGAMLFKEFSADGRRLETRLIQRTGEGRFDYWMGAFVWDESESDALFVPEGREDVLGTQHDVPSVKQCGTCHHGEPGRVLGFSAEQLAGDPPEPALVTLIERGALSHLPASYGPPGDATTARALGYLHANCGNCHNPNGSAWPDTDMVLRLSVEERSADDSELYRTTVAAPLTNFGNSGLTLRVAPGDPEQSGVLFRMTRRDPENQMPPIASEVADAEGVADVRAWIEQLSP